MARTSVADQARSVLVRVRLTPAEVERLDGARNSASRSDYLRSLIPEAELTVGSEPVATQAVATQPVTQPSGRHFHTRFELVSTTMAAGRPIENWLCSCGKTL